MNPAAGTDDTSIIEGAETIDMQEGNPHGILLLHGFGDTPQTLALLAADLHASGYDVRAPLLPGHGRSVSAFMKSRRGDWLGAARSEYAKLRAGHASVSVTGLSMGGALAAILAAENRDMSSLCLVAPYLGMPLALQAMSAWHWIWGPLAGARKSTSPRSILDPDERAKNLGYKVYSGRLLHELWRIAAEGKRALPRVQAPTLILQSRQDPRVAPSTAEHALSRLGAPEKRLVWADEGGHIITVDFGRERVFEEIREWTAAHLPEKR